MGKLRTVAAVLLLLFMSQFVYAQESGVSIYDLAVSAKAVFRWNPGMETGELSKRGDVVRFKIGIPFILINYSKKVESVKVFRGKNGAVYISQNGADAVLDLFRERTPAPGSMVVKAIIIDPGHGGKDPGAIGRHVVDGERIVLKEKNLVLDVAKDVFMQLKAKYPDKEIIMTRNSDKYITLEGRTEIANRVKLKDNEAMIFVSIHANASLNSRSKGFEIWYLPTDYRRELIDTDSLDKDLHDVAPILNSMLEEEFTVESILLAKQIQSGLEKTVGDVIPDRGLKEESWFVVRNAKMPAVLIELGFVTNRAEALIMRKDEYLKKISEGIYNGIRNFVDHFDITIPE